ncbi:hypothetical protein Tco_0389539 [Tanacetum coccineum]
MVFGRKRNHDDMQEDNGVNDVGDDEENTNNNESAAQTQTQSQTNDGKPLLSEVVMVSTGNSKMQGDREKYEELRRKVSNAEQVGVSTKKPIE